ncbi:DUF871 domain-containing protein [Candidatus Enterococcus clewellii]|uniref:DUF871 domain-containing protein n=1 Tax=Candidatus Enterococcus clewellii TaxID=1834193 RepID=A0A242KCU1_9ENTE|nr:MupG family TIM beta-alpha barrel fold protein [Enterococcus sp. 9E7_DIV0242]OTP18360.1 hypothetical protein A5888_000174 [Enterococcus sp. 9E7_DIV0242]
MYGISVFLGQEMTAETKCYIRQMSGTGFKGIFTSLHIPEEDASLYLERLRKLGAIAKSEKMKLMVDISGDALERAGFSFERINELLELGVTGLRMDYAITNEQMAKLSHELTIGLNASTLTEADIRELQTADANFDNFEAWHNYYPRPETGLDQKTFDEKNGWLKENNIRVYAFVSGNKELRGPLFEGLPTVEQYRYSNPLAAGLKLKKLQVDGVYIGDPQIDQRTIRQYDFYLNQNLLVLETIDIGSQYYAYVLGEHSNRYDDARDVVRSAEARFREIPMIKPEFIRERAIGSVTVDNVGYSRYMGEIQVVKNVLPKDEKVNVVSEIVKEDLMLIQAITGGTKFKLVKKGFFENESGKSNN